MGFVSKLIYATLVPKSVKDAIMIDELKKKNKGKKKKK